MKYILHKSTDNRKCYVWKITLSLSNAEYTHLFVSLFHVISWINSSAMENHGHISIGKIYVHSIPRNCLISRVIYRRFLRRSAVASEAALSQCCIESQALQTSPGPESSYLSKTNRVKNCEKPYSIKGWNQDELLKRKNITAGDLSTLSRLRDALVKEPVWKA